jgi:hypothetical protein
MSGKAPCRVIGVGCAAVDVDLSEFEDADTELRLQKSIETLQRQLRDAKDRSQRLVDAAHQGAFDAFLSLGKLPPIATPKADRRRKPEAALWSLGDWQYGKYNSTYGSEIARKRVMYFCDKAQRITEIQRADHPVRDATIIFGGDMLEGVSFQFPTQPFEIDQTIFGQWTDVSRLMVDVVRRALSIYEKVTVIGEHGNHGRIGSKRDAVPQSDNLDRMAFHLAREILAGEDRLTWTDTPDDIKRLEIGNYRALVFHGDEIGRSGYAAPTTLVNWLVRQQSGAYPWDFLDGYVYHFHQNQEWSLPGNGGRLFMTGSTETGNAYASVSMASSAVPSQRLHFVDPEKGRVTSQHVIWLAEA